MRAAGRGVGGEGDGRGEWVGAWRRAVRREEGLKLEKGAAWLGKQVLSERDGLPKRTDMAVRLSEAE